VVRPADRPARRPGAAMAAGLGHAHDQQRRALPPTRRRRRHAAKAKVFISYSRSDEAFAITLGRDIEARGIEAARCRRYAAGEDGAAPAVAHRCADAIVFVLSRRSVDSKVCRDEVAYGELKKRIFPAVIGTSIGRACRPVRRAP